MTLPRSETPLRRSAVGSHLASMLRDITVVNDDDAERRAARRCSLLQQQMRPRDSSVLESIEENENIRKCLEIYNGNKLSRENAWSLSLIDTLSNLLDRHHKTLSNFKMAGSSLEASSKVYGLRVDSIYMDAMRISAGLSARKLTEQQLNEAADRDSSIVENAQAEASNDNDGGQVAAPKPKKRSRKNMSTVTKNKETLNARLDTAPLQDPIFGKLNSTVGSINASNRLMHNILPTADSELKLRTSYGFWDSGNLSAGVTDYAKVDIDLDNYETKALVSGEWAKNLQRRDQMNDLKLRPLHSGYIITDTPMQNSLNEPEKLRESEDMGSDYAGDLFDSPKEISMAFDINAHCEPVPDLDGPVSAVLGIDDHDMEELTSEEQTALQLCRPLRKQRVVIDDLRPVDGSKLEYSYRPMDKISQFWAGPSYWKFKRLRPRTTLGLANFDTTAGAITAAAARARRVTQQVAKRRGKLLHLGDYTESLFHALDTNSKLRKANYQKRWDARKLMLPTKLEFDADYFYKYDFAPSIRVTQRFGEVADSDDMDMDEGLAMDDNELFGNDNRDTTHLPSTVNVSTMVDNNQLGPGVGNQLMCSDINNGGCNDTILEIATEFKGAPSQVTKVIVPFAKRAKVIDMKNLKRSCNSLIQKQFLNPIPDETIPVHQKGNTENYAIGMASFKEIYKHLPNMLSSKMAESLSPSVALYAVLHLANDNRLRLIAQEDLKNFTIRQVID